MPDRATQLIRKLQKWRENCHFFFLSARVGGKEKPLDGKAWVPAQFDSRAAFT
jgi:hypothetical protein